MIICITGCSRGIGKALSLGYANKGHIVIAGMRNIEQGASHPSIIKIPQDISRPQEAAKSFLSALQGRAIDLLIHNAGIYPQKGRDSLTRSNAETISHAVQINAAVAIELSRHLFTASVFAQQAKIVGMSSLLGSIASVSSTRDYSYAMSKAAMNMGFMIMAKELYPHGIDCFMMSPGWIQTDMGGTDAPFTLEKAFPYIIDSIDHWKRGDPSFIDNKGNKLAW